MNTTFDMVNVDDLLISHHHGTQRVEGVNARRVAQITAEWDLSKVGTITVSKRSDGTLFVPDGAHRVTAAREVGQDALPAVIHHGLSRSQEASLFVGLNTFAQPTAVSRFLARVDEGEEIAGDIKRIVEAHGWRIGMNADSGYISAIAAVERSYRSAAGTLPEGAHPEVLDGTLDIITAAWEHDRDSAHGAVIQGVAQLVGRFGAEMDAKRLVSAMSQTRPLVLIGKAKTFRDAVGGTLPAHLAKVLVGLHNSKRRTNLLPEWVWTR